MTVLSFKCQALFLLTSPHPSTLLKQYTIFTKKTVFQKMLITHILYNTKTKIGNIVSFYFSISQNTPFNLAQTTVYNFHKKKTVFQKMLITHTYCITQNTKIGTLFLFTSQFLKTHTHTQTPRKNMIKTFFIIGVLLSMLTTQIHAQSPGNGISKTTMACTDPIAGTFRKRFRSVVVKSLFYNHMLCYIC